MECKWFSGMYGKWFFRFFCESDVDIFCLQKIKLPEGQLNWNQKEIKEMLVLQTKSKRQKMTELFGVGFIDTFRYFYPDKDDMYSWWSYRFKSREKNVGWRMDYFLMSEELKEVLKFEY